MDGTPTIEVLSNELLTRITDYADKSTLRRLRLSNKRIKAIVLERFASSHFGELRTKMTMESFQTLFNICAHPEFGQYIREISLGTVCLPEEGIDQLAESFSSTPQVMSRYDDEDGYYDGDARLEMVTYVRDLANQSTLMQKGEGLELLTRALERLKGYQSAIILGTHDNEYSQELHVQRYYDWHSSGLWWKDRTATFGMLLKAIERSAYPAKHLDIFIEWSPVAEAWKPGGWVRRSSLKTRSIRSKLMRKICANLLSIRVDHHVYDGVTDKRTVASIQHILSCAPKLESLKLNLGDEDEDPKISMVDGRRLDKFTPFFATNNLRELELAKLTGSAASFYSILQHHQKTLRVLSLEKCAIWPKGCWIPILELISTSLALDKITLEELCSVDETGPYLTWREDIHDKCVEGGPLAVCSWLDQELKAIKAAGDTKPVGQV